MDRRMFVRATSEVETLEYRPPFGTAEAVP